MARSLLYTITMKANAKNKKNNGMSGVVSKKHFFLIAKEFGIKKAVKVLLSKEPVALMLLIA